MSLYDRIQSKKKSDNNTEEQMELVKLIRNIRAELLLKVQSQQLDRLNEEELKQEILTMIDEYIEGKKHFLSKDDKTKLVVQIVQDVNGLGPIQVLLDNDDISEIMVNGPNKIFIELNGRIVLSEQKFLNDEHVLNVIEKIISPIGRRIDEGSPMVDARLQDGSRLNAIIPPLALMGPTMTIRKFKKQQLSINDLIQYQTLNQQMADYLCEVVKNRYNILVAGGTGSGKTTLLNILSSFIPHDERIITIEDSAELQLNQPHIVSLETRPPNVEGKGEITINDLVRNSLRMRPDRIIVGEVRGEEALNMLQAMNTGHDGSLSTIHANTPRDVVSRLETLILMSGYDIPLKAIRQQIASSIDLIILQKRFPNGKRKITHITKVEGIEKDMIILQDIFIYKLESSNDKSKGDFVKTGFILSESDD